MSAQEFDAVIFDLDGVITNTASIHSKAWKIAIDDFLKQYASKHDSKYKAFDIKEDYCKYVDGKPRYEGVESFLSSRNIHLDFGNAEDKPGYQTYCAIGNKKNEIFHHLLDSEGAEIFSSTIEFINELISNDILIGVASSSKNCEKILDTTGLSKLFLTRIDGINSAEMGLKGKPEPDIFLQAAKNLNVHPSRTIVVEDAESGVQAAQKGGFGLVIGIARHDNEQTLKAMGADIVINDLEELTIENIESWFETGLEEDLWSIKYTDYLPEKEKSRESLLSIGNGYFVTRGVMGECKASDTNYPGTYMAGVYNELPSEIAGKTIYNEDLVNCPNWIFSNFKIEDEDWITLKNVKIIDFERRLNIRNGLLSGWMLIEDKKGRQTLVETLRFASMDKRNIAALEHAVSPINYAANITLCTEIDGDIVNAGVERYQSLNQNHTEVTETGFDNNSMWVQSRTTQSKIDIAIAAHVYSKGSDENIIYTKTDKAVRATCSAYVPENGDLAIVKIIGLSNSLSNSQALEYVKNLIAEESDFELLAAQTRRAWHKIWEQIDIQIVGDRHSQKLVRLHLYHMMLSYSPHVNGLDVSIPARGLHGEAYRGHIFWDEVFMLPLYNMHFPELTKQALLYRYHRLPEARKYAQEHGFKGAMFPWQSGSDGSEQTQIIHLNPKSGKWDPDYSSLQRHISLAIALNIVRYYQHTGNKLFMQDYGMEMLFEISRFWASMAKKDSNGKFHISGVMGPDEFHEKYPNSDKGGLTDNAYTNMMCVWLWNKTLHITSNLGIKLFALMQKLEINAEELDYWNILGSHIHIPVSEDGIIEQFNGYFNLEEFNWQEYREKYGSINRADRLLKAEGLSPDTFKIAKQADTLMTFYNLNNQEIKEIFDAVKIELPSDFEERNFTYYYERTSHGSTLSKLVHASLANKWNLGAISWSLFNEALQSDYNDSQGGTTAEGIHAGVMAGTVLQTISEFAGIDFRDYNISINPKLPTHWINISCKFQFRNTNFELSVFKDSINIKADKDIGIKIQGIPTVIEKDDWWNIDIN
jgi:beta-phosphoglucomutase family hydrolase